MAEQLYIVTGASRGLGAALAEQLLVPGHLLLLIARQRHPSLRSGNGATVEQWTQDLAQPGEAARRLRDWLGGLDGRRFAAATLINNAGVVSAPGPLQSGGLDELSTALRVGLEAPVLLTASFLAATAAWPSERRVLNISSGLGRRAIAGTATYCAAKAGMDHYSRAVALEQAAGPHGAKIDSLAPGVIDTDMQVGMRAADPARFPERARFVGFRDSGALVTPAAAAGRVLAYLRRPDFGSEPVASVAY